MAAALSGRLLQRVCPHDATAVRDASRCTRRPADAGQANAEGTDAPARARPRISRLPERGRSGDDGPCGGFRCRAGDATACRRRRSGRRRMRRVASSAARAQRSRRASRSSPRRARTCRASRRRGLLGVMGLRDAPGKASQFAHESLSYVPMVRPAVSGASGFRPPTSCNSDCTGYAAHRCNGCSQKKEPGCRAQKGDLVLQRSSAADPALVAGAHGRKDMSVAAQLTRPSRKHS